jgi:CBS domain-containing protein
MYVEDCMHTAVTTVTPDTLVSTAYRIMRREWIRHLPVVTDERRLVGVVTDRDIRRAAASDAPHMAEHELIYLLEELRVRDIMTPEVVTVHGTTPLVEAGRIFLQKKFGCLPVVHDNNTLAGIITVTDLLQASIAQHKAGAEGLRPVPTQSRQRLMRVRSMMQTQIITATPEMSLAEVQRLMRDHNIRHVPVVSGQRLVGMITDRDIREAAPSPATTLTRGEIAYQMETTSVETCMTRDIVCIGPEAEMTHAPYLLVRQRIGCLPVVDHGTLVGIVTEMDCLRAFLETARSA